MFEKAKEELEKHKTKGGDTVSLPELRDKRYDMLLTQNRLLNYRHPHIREGKSGTDEGIDLSGPFNEKHEKIPLSGDDVRTKHKQEPYFSPQTEIMMRSPEILKPSIKGKREWLAPDIQKNYFEGEGQAKSPVNEPQTPNPKTASGKLLNPDAKQYKEPTYNPGRDDLSMSPDLGNLNTENYRDYLKGKPLKDLKEKSDLPLKAWGGRNDHQLYNDVPDDTSIFTGTDSSKYHVPDKGKPPIDMWLPQRRQYMF